MGKKNKLSKEERIILERDAELKYPTDRLGPGSLLTQQSHTNSSRMIMVNHNFSQWVSIRDPELPLVPTGFEKKLGSYCTMNDQAEGDFEVVAKFEKNEFNYVIIGFDKKRRLYHAWKRSPVMEHSEGYATRYNNKYIDELDIGDTIHKGDIVQKSDSFDKHMNYRYGKNLNTVYLVSTKVYEDGITLMNGADELMNTVRSHTITIPISDNEILLNWYGDDKHYQGLPYIGERTRKGYLAIVRQIDGSKAPFALKKKRLQHIERGDRKYYQNGRVVDIDILYNGPRNKLSESVSNKQILELYDAQQEYYFKLHDYMQHIVDTSGDDTHKYTDEFSLICAQAYDYIDSSAYFADNNDSIFGNIQINIQVLNEEKMIVGTKLVGRYGNKGVVNRILEPSKSWKMEDGTPIHVLVSALGIVGRLNQSQMNEHSINEMGATAVSMMKATDDPDQKLTIVYTLMKYLNSDEAKDFKKWTRKMSYNEKVQYCKRIERTGITIFQHPINNANLVDIEKAYQVFPPNYQRIVFPDGGKSLHRLLCSKMFFIRLKQDPVDKYSARSQGPVNPLSMTPSKSSRKKKHLDPYSDVAVRFGEQEMEVLLTMINHPAAVADYMAENSTSLEAKIATGVHNYMGSRRLDEIGFVPTQEQAEELLDAIDDKDAYDRMITNMALSTSTENPWVVNASKKNMEQIYAYMNELSTRIVIETETAPDGEWFHD